MSNAFYDLLRGNIEEDEVVVSLKSTVPVFITYPEIIIPFKFRLTDIIPYYKESEDYEDINRNILLPEDVSPTKLIVMFTKVFELIVKVFNEGRSKLDKMPKVSLKIDIGNSKSQFKTIAPDPEEVDRFDDIKTKMFTLTGFNAAANAEGLSYEQKYNLLLIDTLTRKYNNSGLGGR